MTDVVRVGTFHRSTPYRERLEIEEFEAIHEGLMNTPIDEVVRLGDERLGRHTMELIANIGLPFIDKKYITVAAARTTLSAMAVESREVFLGERSVDHWRPAWPGIVRQEIDTIGDFELFMPEVMGKTRQLIFNSRDTNKVISFGKRVLANSTPEGDYAGYAFAAAVAKGELHFNEDLFIAA